MRLELMKFDRMTDRLLDNPQRYGWVSRLLHWSMAGLLAWQLTGMVLRLILGRVPLMAFWVGTHTRVGTVLLALAATRITWAILNVRRRPLYAAIPLGTAARFGHRILYGLMIVIPALGLLRHYGAGRELRIAGITLMPLSEPRAEWLMLPADLLHGVLAWTLLALIVGHVAMVLLHRFWWKDDILARMTGSTRGAVSTSDP